MESKEIIIKKIKWQQDKTLRKVLKLSEIVNLLLLFTSWNRIGYCRNLPSLSPIFQDHSLPAYEAGSLSGCRRKLPQKSRGPEKATVCDSWQTIQTLQSLRRSVGTFSCRDIQDAVGMNAAISNRSDRQVLYDNGYEYYHPRKKGVLTVEHLPKWLKLDQRCKSLQSTSGSGEYLSILIRLIDSTRQIHANKQAQQGLKCRKRKWKGSIRNAEPRAKKNRQEGMLADLKLSFPMQEVKLNVFGMKGT